MDNVRRLEKATKGRHEAIIMKTKAQRTEAQSSMPSDLAGLLMSICKIVQREESGQSNSVKIQENNIKSGKNL